jgi:hypothetical protein
MSFETTIDLDHRWLTWDMDPSTRAQIEALAASQDWLQLEKCLRTRIQFGTAGLRGPMVAGFANINCLTVIQVSQGVASYFSSSHRGARSVVIGYDIRHQSSKFARLAANAFKRKGIKPILFEVCCAMGVALVAAQFWSQRTQLLTARSNMFLHHLFLSESVIITQTPAL